MDKQKNTNRRKTTTNSLRKNEHEPNMDICKKTHSKQKPKTPPNNEQWEIYKQFTRRTTMLARKHTGKLLSTTWQKPKLQL